MTNKQKFVIEIPDLKVSEVQKHFQTLSKEERAKFLKKILEQASNAVINGISTVIHRRLVWSVIWEVDVL